MPAINTRLTAAASLARQAAIIEAISAGLPVKTIADAHGVTPALVYYVDKKNNHPAPTPKVVASRARSLASRKAKPLRAVDLTTGPTVRTCKCGCKAEVVSGAGDRHPDLCSVARAARVERIIAMRAAA